MIMAMKEEKERNLQSNDYLSVKEKNPLVGRMKRKRKMMMMMKKKKMKMIIVMMMIAEITVRLIDSKVWIILFWEMVGGGGGGGCGLFDLVMLEGV